MDKSLSYTDQDLSQYRYPNSPQSTEYSSTTESTCNCNNSDSPVHISHELLLASSNPKKRSGRKKFKETRHPVYRGIRCRNSGKWVCEVREPVKNTRIWLGTYPTAEMAARANDVAAIALRGRNACLNFADSVWRLPLPASSAVKDIQIAAAKAAEAFRPKKNDVARDTSPDTTLISHENYEVLFMDEEPIFGMPQFINNMAQGMMLPPPQYVQSDRCYGDDDLEDATDMSLWCYKF
ncbi:Dehydration-responsive element-binding protein like [Heracleum sosnowskyi]|uniref:Dehydration-responsive element-binding protein like n=1 Tax=Heracleum sosnowskyi TaxID=360622 RepID=A0AAD8IX15_9APIA|nr:Dehydration-responsive element-binding protein like [Heracleum sosnowskyi]